MRKLIIDGNAVYELDENCMLTREVTQEELKKEEEERKEKRKRSSGRA